MAKKRLDDADWDLSLDYEFEDPFAPVSEQKKRGVITRMATNFAQGAADAFKTPSTLKSIASNMLPTGYGTAINFGSDLYRQGEELHNIALKELEPSLPAMRRITQRNLPKIKRFAPRALAEKLEEFSKPQPGYKAPTDAQLAEESVRAALADVFEVQLEAQSRQSAEERTERALQHAQLASTSRDQLRSLEVMQQGVLRLVDYQDTITNRYQRKSLELQTRSYLLARDQARVNFESTRRMHAQLEMIAKNSAMPDIAKQDMRHTATQSFRNRLLGSAQDSAGRFAQNYFGKMFQRMQNSVREMTGGVNDAMGMSDMGDDVPMLDMVMQGLGSGAVNLGARLGGKYSREFLGRKMPGSEQFGAKLHRILTSAPQYLNRYARSATKREGMVGFGEEMLKDVLRTHTMDPQIGYSGLADMDKPATFDKLARLSIVEVIPGLLSRIEHNTARVLDPTAERQMFNMDRRQFTNLKTAADDMSNRLLTRETRASVKQDVNRFVDELVGDSPLSDDSRKALIRQILLDSGNGLPFDPDHYTSPTTKTPELDARAKMELAEIFKINGMTKDGKRDQVWWKDRSETYNQLNFGAVAPIHAAGVYRSAGYRDLLDQAGLLERDGFKDNLNISKILDMIEEADYGDIKVKEQSAAERFRDEIGRRAKVFGDEITDLYRQGGVKPVLTAARLKAKAYRDQASGAVIEKWEDIRGPVIDLTSNQTVLTMEDLTGDLVNGRGEKIRMRLRQAVTDTANWTQEVFKEHGPKVQQRAQDIKDVLNEKGEVLLSAINIMAGKYRDKLTGTTIKRPEDIAGPVVDDNERTVVTAADVAGTLSTSDGKPLNSASERMRQRTSSVHQATSEAPTAGVFGAAMQDPDQVQNQGATYTLDGEELIRLNSQQVELLKVIADAVMSMDSKGPGGGDGQGDSRRRRGFLDSIALGGIKGAWRGAKAITSGTWWWTKKVGSGSWGALSGTARAAGTLASGAAHQVGNRWRGIKDIYVKGKRKPVLQAERITLGHYQDLNTQKKILRWQDITGPVVDLTTGETVLDQDDFDAGIYVKGLSGLDRLATKSLKTLGSAVVGFYGNVLALPFKAASFAVKSVGTALKWATNKQVDVYVKGESSPRLFATKMKLGRYYNVHPKKMGVKVKTYSDIFGEIKELQPGAQEAGRDDKTVLHEEEITDPGLSNRWGMSLRTPLSRLIGAIGGAAVSVVKGAGALFGGAMRGYGKLFGGMMGLGGGLIGAPFKFLGSLLNPFEKHGAKQVELLEAIRRLLDDRLPGAKARKGSWQEQFAKREEAEKEKEEKTEREERDRKWGVGGLLSFFKDKAKGWFGGGKDADDDDEDGDDGDTTIIAGGGGGGDGKGRRRSTGPAKTGGRYNRWRRNRAAKKLRNQRTKARTPSGGRFGGLGRMGRMASLGGLAGAVAADPLMDAAGLDENSAARGAVNTGMNAWGLYSLLAAGKGLLGWGAGTAATGAAATAATGGLGAAAATGGLAAGGAAAAGTAAAGTAAGVGMGTAAAGTAAAAGGTAAAVLGAPIWVPIAIGAAVVAGVGAAGYYGYRQMKYGKLTPSRRFRFLQYGLKPGDAGHNRKVFLLEELLMNHVGDENGKVDIVSKSTTGGKPISMEDVYKIFGLTDGWIFNKDSERGPFNAWFNQRFKPIFLAWHAAVRAEEPTMSILEADEKLSGEKMGRVLDKAWSISRSLYSLPAGPIPGEQPVTNVSEIEEAYLLAKKESGKSDEERSKDKRNDNLRTALKVAMGPVGWLAGSYMDNQLDEKRAQREAEKLADEKLVENSGDNLLKATGAIGFTKGADEVLPSTLARTGRLTSLMALRFRAYGLNDLDLDRVRALSALEAVVGNTVSISDTGRVHVIASPEEIFVRVAGLFGLTSSSREDRARWIFWYGNRFLPVFVEYVKTIKSLAPSADLSSPERALKADQQLQVGQAILNAKSSDGRPVWNYTASPWSAQERLLSDANMISGTLLALRQAAKGHVATEPTVAGRDAEIEKNQGFLKRAWNGVKGAMQSATDWLLGDKDDRNWLGRAVDGVVNTGRDMAQSASNAFSHAANGNYGAATTTALHGITAPGRSILGAMGMGPGLQHPGKGSGGDINALPNVPSNEEIAAMRPAQRFAVLKPMFDAVAAMTGIDPNMLYSICSIESTFNPNAKAPTSTASGLFQFIRGTWAETLRKHGSKFGISPSASPFDAKANALMGAMFLKDNYNFLKSRVGRNLTETDMYLAHFMGAGGASDFLRRDPNQIGAQAFPAAARANPWIYYAMKREGRRNVPDMSRPLALGEVYNLLHKKVTTAQQVYGGRQESRADFTNVSSSVTTTAGTPAASGGEQPATSMASPDFAAVSSPADTAAHTDVRTPTTTSTTANGALGGVGGVEMAPASTGVNMTTTGGGYAAMAATGALPGADATVAPAPRLDSVASLEAAAQSSTRDEALRQDALRRAAAEEERRRREMEAQSLRMSQVDQQRSSHSHELLERQLKEQVEIRKNTGDTVTLLRQLLHSRAGQAPSSTVDTTPATPETQGPRTRPYEGRESGLPISVRFDKSS